MWAESPGRSLGSLMGVFQPAGRRGRLRSRGRQPARDLRLGGGRSRRGQEAGADGQKTLQGCDPISEQRGPLARLPDSSLTPAGRREAWGSPAGLQSVSRMWASALCVEGSCLRGAPCTGHPIPRLSESGPWPEGHHGSNVCTQRPGLEQTV